MQAEANALGARYFRETGLAATVADLVEPVIESLGFRLVRVHISGRDGKTLQIMAERPDGSFTIEDCEAVSRQLSPLLDANDVVSDAYRLEISSPGIDRPLVRPSDFEDWAGHEVKVDLKQPIDGRRKLKGTLDGYEDGEVRVEVDLEEVGPKVLGVPIGLVSEARLVLTDDLIREALSRSKLKDKTGFADGAEPGDFVVDDNEDN